MSDGSSQVELSVRSQLTKIIEDLNKIAQAQGNVTESLKDMGEKTGAEFQKQTKNVETFLTRLRGLGSRVSQQLKDDFKSLISINALGESLRLSNQFRGSIKEAVSLSDTIRKLGSTFGITSGKFVSFQTKMIKGLGELGLGSAVAASTMEGLADTTVRGEGSVLGYSKTAGQLASTTKTQGREGDIAKGIAKVITARGGDANNMSQVADIAENLRRAFNQTGKSPVEMLGAMEDLYRGMSQDFRKTMSSRGLTSLASAGQIAGPNSTKFLEEYLGKSPIARAAMDAQGFKGVIGDQGIDVDKFSKMSKAVLSRVGGDPRLAAQTLGLSEDAAEGFIRLSESLDRVRAAQAAIQSSTGSLESQYRASMGFSEAFQASINRVKKVIAKPLSAATQYGTDLMSKAAGSDLGSAGLVAGGGVLAALLAGGGLRGIGKGLRGGIGGMAGAAATEAITGRQVVPVFVTNASQMGGGMLGAASGSGALGTVGKVMGAAGLAYGVGAASASLMQSNPVGSADSELGTIEKVGGKTAGDVYEKLYNLLARMNNGVFGTKYEPLNRQQKVIVELNQRDLKATKQPTRGASY